MIVTRIMLIEMIMMNIDGVDVADENIDVDERQQ